MAVTDALEKRRERVQEPDLEAMAVQVRALSPASAPEDRGSEVAGSDSVSYHRFVQYIIFNVFYSSARQRHGSPGVSFIWKAQAIQSSSQTIS